MPDIRGGHGHGHGHGPGADQAHDAARPPAPPGPPDESGADGRAVRAAKDDPGRHDADYYGAPGKGASPKRPVPRSQGERSFARKRPV